jgi:hypothetical protein
MLLGVAKVEFGKQRCCCVFASVSIEFSNVARKRAVELERCLCERARMTDDARPIVWKMGKGTLNRLRCVQVQVEVSFALLLFAIASRTRSHISASSVSQSRLKINVAAAQS